MNSKKAYVVASVFFLVLLSFSLCIGLFFYNNTETLRQEIIASRQTTIGVVASAIQVKLSHLIDIASSTASEKILISDIANGQWENAAGAVRDSQNNIGY